LSPTSRMDLRAPAVRTIASRPPKSSADGVPRLMHILYHLHWFLASVYDAYTGGCPVTTKNGASA